MPEKTVDQISRTAYELYQKGIAAVERNNFDYAVEMLLQCLNLEPAFIQGRKHLRAVQMKRAEAQSALKRAMAGAKIQPLLLRARAVLGKNPQEAMNIVEQALCEDPKNAQALLLLAEAAEAAGLLEVTVQTLEHYHKLYPRDTKNAHWLARTYIAVSRFDMARAVYDHILQINPADFEAQKGIKDASAHGAMKRGGWEQAVSYRDVIKDKEEAVALEQASRVVRAEDMIDNLIKENLAKLQNDPHNPVIRRELGKLYGQKGDYDRALEYLEALFQAEAGADPTLEKEITELREKRIADKIEAKKKQLEADPRNATLQAELKQLESEFAQMQLQDAIRLVEKYPNDLMYRYELGVLYMKTGNIQGAIEQFQRSVGQPQRRIASLNYLGQCFQQLGLHDLAVDQYLRALEDLPLMDGVKKEITYNLATAYEALGETEKAIAEYKKIAAVDFGYRDVRDKIARRPVTKAA
ncbi:MAG: tetratricopeptide repeat protein [Verrucomicrobiae bacterium]|nr:tetratricopeptide repeat protein [Verrucomicrobiae bacterium]